MAKRLPFVAPFHGDLTIKQDGSLWINGEQTGWIARLDFHNVIDYRHGRSYGLSIDADIYPGEPIEETDRKEI